MQQIIRLTGNQTIGLMDKRTNRTGLELGLGVRYYPNSYWQHGWLLEIISQFEILPADEGGV